MNGESAGAGAVPPGGVILARVDSVPMAELASLCLKPSDNLIAHQLWLHVGADVRRRPRNGEAPGAHHPPAATGAGAPQNPR